MEVTLIFPHQLFEKNPALRKDMKVYLIEEELFFNQYKFHKQKLAFHRASMKSYESFLKSKKVEVEYIEAISDSSDVRSLIGSLKAEKIHFIDPVDNYLRRRLTHACNELEIPYEEHDSPGFLNKWEDLEDFFKTSKKKFFQTDFYKNQRISANILIEQKDKPVGGQWTFDKENRKRYPAKSTPPSISFPDKDKIYKEALDYVNANFSSNPGKLSENPVYPYSHKASNQWFAEFLEQRFVGFGDYEDAIVSNEHFLHHSILSPLLNTGLLTPKYVVNEILHYAEKEDVPINNTEGIIRQIIGWREFIRGVYIAKGSQERTNNFWGFKRKIPPSFYDGSTGINPVDITIKKLLKTGYNHHIERLMVLGNFMLLCEFDPDEVYRWFMELYIDAYDWVMVPNVYGMSQFADGGLMSTKPYISGSNYLMKMGDYEKGDWQQTWDGLFWRFMDKHRDFFTSNPRLGMLVGTFDKMKKEKQKNHLKLANDYLSSL